MRWAVLDTAIPFGFAHQGGDDVAPGNTLASFEHAVSLGYRYIETDVQATADGVLVIFHDTDLQPTTGVEGRIEDLTWEQVSRLRVGGEHPIQRFDEVVERFVEVRFNIEPKADTAVQPLIDAIRRFDLADRVLIGSFDDARLRRVRKALGPELATSPGPIGLAKLLLKAVVAPDRRSRYAAVQIPASYFSIPLASRWLIERFHRMGLQVHVWTINEEGEMLALLDKGVDAIMSDRTALLRDVLHSDGRRPDDGAPGA